MARAITLDEVLEVLGGEVMEVFGARERAITQAAPIRGAQHDQCVTFCSKAGADGLDVIRATKAGVVLCEKSVAADERARGSRTLVIVRAPRESFARLVRALFGEPRPRGIHPTAVVDPEARISESTYIGPFTYVGKCEIGEGTVIWGHVHIYDANVSIGRNVTIHSGSIIGTDGFGYVRNANERLELFPSIGGVIIDDDVDIHAQVNVDRGTLGNTIIGTGSKIDKFCHIGHNAVVGKHCVITAHSMLGGGAQIGDYSWIAPCGCIRDGGIRIGKRSVIGMAAVVTKDVPDGATVMGMPARPEEEYKRLLKEWRKIATL